MALRGPRGLLAGLAACLAAPRTPAAPAGGSAALLVVGEVTGPLRQPGQDADALKVEFSMRKQIWGDHDGSLYYSSHAGHRLYKMDAAGSLRTVAGNGQPGWWGDGGLANQAGVRYPGPVWGDRSGHVFFVDNASSCLRRIDTQGIIATVAAFSWPRPSIGALWGDRSGDLYVTDTERRQVLRLRAEGDGYAEEVFAGRAPAATPAPLGHSGDGGPALHARLAQPNGLWGDDSGSLYVAEMAGHRIRRIDRAGRISTVAGTGSPGYSGDHHGGVATSARLKCPCDLWGDGYGSLFVADMGNHRIRRVDPQEATSRRSPATDPKATRATGAALGTPVSRRQRVCGLTGTVPSSSTPSTSASAAWTSAARSLPSATWEAAAPSRRGAGPRASAWGVRPGWATCSPTPAATRC
ncbi:unnamed protein product [Prorocentrum cordatum]|uniref:Teneurin NHL domain-containing protein n=1 Tax=Prorocentrum cordatum TaxID=2364126 RepID=A0ABN9U2A3_9DINO|nr:unnamed protein product [Polarella glacialis]